MASTITTNPLFSSTFLGNQILVSPPTGKSTNFPSLSKRKFLIPKALALGTPNPSNPPPLIQSEAPKPNPLNSSPFSQNLLLTAPKPQTQTTSDPPDGSQWRHSEFLNSVKKGKVESVRFSKDGQITATDGIVTVPAEPNVAADGTFIVPADPEVAADGTVIVPSAPDVDNSVSEGESGNGLVGIAVFPVLAIAGLIWLFRVGD